MLLILYFNDDPLTMHSKNISIPDHVLDNPIWNAMISSNSDLAYGTSHIKFFREDISPFAGMKQVNQELLQQLLDLISYERVVAIVTPLSLNIPAGVDIIRQAKLLQMIRENAAQPSFNTEGIVPLTKRHVPQMLALTQLTNPGPFLESTISFGSYNGIFNAGELVAMTGTRLHVNQYVEVSAVCTHPGHTGKGYGSRLILNQVSQIIKEGNIPFLHVAEDNHAAIQLYQRLGFNTRQVMNLYVLQKAG